MTIHLKHVNYEVIFESLEGQIECGDQCFIKESDDNILLAVMDGLGHGEEAAYAAKIATQILDFNSNEPLETLVKLCNQALIKTRGVAMTILRTDSNYILTYIAIGNVLGVCWNRDNHAKLKKQLLFLHDGIVGFNLPSSIQTRKIAMGSGDVVILATDGINNQFELELPTMDTPKKIAEKIFNAYRNKKDDGLLLVAQLL